MDHVIHLDGAMGEGGGQILRSALALSLITGTPVHLHNIRAGRKKPGLLRQHLTAVEAARRIGMAFAVGAELGSLELEFIPQGIVPGHYSFAVGTAGSATLVLQTILPALLTAGGPSSLVLEGGTHNPFAPPFDFLEKVYLPLLCRMGPRVSAKLERHGFFPAGGGRFTVSIDPVPELRPIELLERGALLRRQGRALVARLGRQVARRELGVLMQQLGLRQNELTIEEITTSPGPGNVVMLELESEHAMEIVTSFGARGVAAEQVAEQAAKEAQRYLAAAVPVGEHLADQLLLPFAMAGSGAYRTVFPSLHTTTNIEVIQKFLDVQITVEAEANHAAVIRVSRG